MGNSPERRKMCTRHREANGPQEQVTVLRCRVRVSNPALPSVTWKRRLFMKPIPGPSSLGRVLVPELSDGVCRTQSLQSWAKSRPPCMRPSQSLLHGAGGRFK